MPLCMPLCVFTPLDAVVVAALAAVVQFALPVGRAAIRTRRGSTFPKRHVRLFTDAMAGTHHVLVARPVEVRVDLDFGTLAPVADELAVIIDLAKRRSVF